MTDKEILSLITEVCPYEDSVSPYLDTFQVVKIVRAALNNSSIIDANIENPEIQRCNLYAIMSIYLQASEEVRNRIYDPIEEAIKEIQTKYTIIQKE